MNNEIILVKKPLLDCSISINNTSERMDVPVDQLIYVLTSKDIFQLNQPEIVFYLELAEKMNSNSTE